MACTLQTEHVQWTIGVDGRSLGWIDLGDQQDYCPASHPPVATVKKAGKYHAATAAELKDGLLELQFGDSGVQAVLRATAKPRYLLVEVVSLVGEGAEELVFVDLPLTLKGQPGEPLAACALALNLKTKVNELPQPSSQLRAACYPRFGFAGPRWP